MVKLIDTNENTIKRKGFDKIKGISITVETISKINVENWFLTKKIFVDMK